MLREESEGEVTLLVGSGNRNKVFFISFLDQIFFQLLNGFPETFVFTEFILKLSGRLTPIFEFRPLSYRLTDL